MFFESMTDRPDFKLFSFEGLVLLGGVLFAVVGTCFCFPSLLSTYPRPRYLVRDLVGERLSQQTTNSCVTRTIGNNSIQITVSFLYRCVYNLFFHPLKHIPGPLLARATAFPYVYKIRTGEMHSWLQEQHEKYGEVVRVAPQEVSFISAETAWSDIYGFRTGKYKGTGAYLKDCAWL